jgi:hypothetical protein
MAAMRDLMRFPLADGGEVVVEVDPHDLGVGRASRPGETIQQALVTYEEALDSVRRTADATLRSLRNMEQVPDELEVTFAVRLSGEVGAVIAKAGGEANLSVKLTWHGPSPA